jgi:hypothetical protein
LRLFRRLAPDQKRSIGHWTIEFVIVLAGVLAALWLQQWDQQRRERAEMRAAERAIHDEVRETLKSLIWREAIAKCHEERIAYLQSKLLERGSAWQPVPENALFTNLGNLPGSIAKSVYQRPLDTFTDAAWTSALATGAIRSMDRQRFATLVAVYDAVHVLQKTRELEDHAATVLSPLGLPVELTPEMRADMLRGIYDVDRSRFTFALINPRDLADTMKELGWNDAAEIDESIRASAQDAASRGLRFRPCIAAQKNPFRAR